MSTRWCRRAAAREWCAALGSFGLLLGVPGCQVVQSGFDFNGDGAGNSIPTGPGVFIASDHAQGAIAAARAPNGDLFFAYGTRGPSGELGEVQALLVQQTDGAESSIEFESGRATRVTGPDGSFARITYESVTTQRLTATVDLFDAAAGMSETHVVDVDLARAVNEVAEQVRAATGQTIAVVSDTQALAAAAGGGTQKALDSAARITIFSPLLSLFVLPFVAVVAIMTSVLGQILVAMFSVVAIVAKVALLTIFAPFLLIGAIFSGALVRIDVLPLQTLFLAVPRHPGRG
jgi:hypothetical protein